jgi:hypothetical protein
MNGRERILQTLGRVFSIQSKIAHPADVLPTCRRSRLGVSALD